MLKVVQSLELLGEVMATEADNSYTADLVV